jgi:hypothetical protein
MVGGRHEPRAWVAQSMEAAAVVWAESPAEGPCASLLTVLVDRHCDRSTEVRMVNIVRQHIAFGLDWVAQHVGWTREFMRLIAKEIRRGLNKDKIL